MKDRGSIEVSPQDVLIRDRRGQVHSFPWNSVDRILSYKVDLITTDDVCLEFVVGDLRYVADEDTAGWEELAKEMMQRFSVLPSWFDVVVHPAFATNMAVLWDRSIEDAIKRLSPSRSEELWRLVRSDFQRDGSLRDIYISHTTEADWNQMLAIARGMFGPVSITSAGRELTGGLSAKHFRGKKRADLRFRVGETDITAHCFDVSEIELSFSPQQLQCSSDLSRLLQFVVSTAVLLKRPGSITPENAPNLPILRVEPTGDIQFVSPHAA